jgi:hypothetical protein
MVAIQPTIADDPVAVMGWRLGNRDARFGRVPWLPAIPTPARTPDLASQFVPPGVHRRQLERGSSEIELGMLAGATVGPHLVAISGLRQSLK